MGQWPPHRPSELENISQQLAYHHHQYLSYYECCKQATGTCRDDFHKLERQPQQDGWVGRTGPRYTLVCTLSLRQIPMAEPLPALPLTQPQHTELQDEQRQLASCLLLIRPCSGMHLCTSFSWFTTADAPSPLKPSITLTDIWSPSNWQSLAQLCEVTLLKVYDCMHTQQIFSLPHSFPWGRLWYTSYKCIGGALSLSSPSPLPHNF